MIGCGDGRDSGDGGAASASPRVEEPPPVPPPTVPEATSLPIPSDSSPTIDSWDAEADDALLTPEENNEPEEEETEQQVQATVISMFFYFVLFFFSDTSMLYVSCMVNHETYSFVFLFKLFFTMWLYLT